LREEFFSSISSGTGTNGEKVVLFELKSKFLPLQPVLNPKENEEKISKKMLELGLFWGICTGPKT
jgi:hypothetical protein